MTIPPIDQDWPQLWMTVGDVFHIRGRGTVVTGRLEGSGRLNLGDSLVCDGMHWQVSGIEQFRAALTVAEPGTDIGILLGGGPAGDVLRGRTVQFEPGSATKFEPDSASASLQFTVLAPKRKRWRR
jgi:elongation factor Tu